MADNEDREYEKYVRMIKEIYPNWDDETIKKKICEVIDENTQTTQDGRRLTWLTRSGAAKLLFVSVGGIEKKEGPVKIEKIVEGLSGIVIARILRIAEPRDVTFQDGTVHKVCDVIVGDDTGSLTMSLWDERIESISGFNRDDALKLSGCIYQRNKIVCRSFEEADEEESKDLPFADEVPLCPRRFLATLARQFGQVCECRCQTVGVFRSSYIFNACPNCGSSLKGAFCYKCKEEVSEPNKKARAPVMLDDGTMRIRGVLWDQTLKKLAGKGIKLVEICTVDFNRAYEMLKELLLGKELLIRGYIVKSDFGLELRISDADFVAKLEPELKFIFVTK
jgi:hypothetical protein